MVWGDSGAAASYPINYGFEIQRLQDYTITKLQDSNPVWKVVGFKKGNGNSNTTKEYSFIDKDVMSGNYLYRLKQVDIDGAFEYSKVAEVSFAQPIEFSLNQNYRNPFNPATTIGYGLPVQSIVKIEVFNILGERITQLVK